VGWGGGGGGGGGPPSRQGAEAGLQAAVPRRGTDGDSSRKSNPTRERWLAFWRSILDQTHAIWGCPPYFVILFLHMNQGQGTTKQKQHRLTAGPSGLLLCRSSATAVTSANNTPAGGPGHTFLFPFFLNFFCALIFLLRNFS